MSIYPLEKNTVGIVTLAFLGTLGIVVRMFVRIPLIPGLLELTPGFLFSELGGVVGGIPGGILVGTIVGIGGAIAGGEVPLLPLIGNMALGLGTGYAIHITKTRDGIKYAILAILGGGIIGGFIPSMTIFAGVGVPFETVFFYAFMDMIQAFLWAIVAIVVEKQIIRPVIGHYLYPNMGAKEELVEDPKDD
ncbi:MAG: conserved membrane protein of unknown function [Candidatus Thorarchaeota archaeon]|nr:MAG: conserved membrane protein of unknown function [Candidatus Thorarchaeota archaeon]